MNSQGREAGNRLMHQDYVLWQGENFKKVLGAIAVPLLLVPLDMADLAGDLGLPAGGMMLLALPLMCLPVLSYYVYKHRKLSLSTQGMVMYSLRKTRQVAWRDVRSVKVKLRAPFEEAAGGATLYVTRHDGGKLKHVLTYIAGDHLPWLAKDLHDAVGGQGVQIEVAGSRGPRRAFEELQAQAQQDQARQGQGQAGVPGQAQYYPDYLGVDPAYGQPQQSGAPDPEAYGGYGVQQHGYQQSRIPQQQPYAPEPYAPEPYPQQPQPQPQPQQPQPQPAYPPQYPQQQQQPPQQWPPQQPY